MSQKDKEIHFLRRQIFFFSVNLKYYLLSLNLALLDLSPILVPNPKGTAWKKTCTKAKACNSHLIWECLKTLTWAARSGSRNGSWDPCAPCSLLWKEQCRSPWFWGVYTARQGAQAKVRWLNLVNTCLAGHWDGWFETAFGNWLRRVMGVKDFGTQRQYSAIQDLIFLPRYKSYETSIISLSMSTSLCWQLQSFSALQALVSCPTAADQVWVPLCPAQRLVSQGIHLLEWSQALREFLAYPRGQKTSRKGQHLKS